MKIAILRERADGEQRTAISPEVTKLFAKKEYKVFIEKDAGIKSGFSNECYAEAGATISNVPLEIVSDADIILKVQPSPLINEINEIDLAKDKAIIIGLLSPTQNSQYLSKLSNKGLSAISMELVPRITRAQNIDVLSSQSNLAGYRAVIEASYHFNRIFPMMMTAAGTIPAAKVLVLGVGVAGLQAIATAKRLGASVSAYDVRIQTKEQVESLGARFIGPDNANDIMEDKSGYAKEASNEYKIKQEQFLGNIIKNYDIIITTAQIPGKKAPVLITEKMLKEIKPFSVIVDMATATGGNVEGSKDGINIINDVKIVGFSNLPSKVSSDSSKLYARNLYNFIDIAVKNGKFDFEDDIVKQMLLIKEGKVINASF